jgi:hypothetical protein
MTDDKVNIVTRMDRKIAETFRKFVIDRNTVLYGNMSAEVQNAMLVYMKVVQEASTPGRLQAPAQSLLKTAIGSDKTD